ncbi:MAG: tetratricopeptide repeat protein, partial [Acidobacteriota bacterium]
SLGREVKVGSIPERLAAETDRWRARMIESLAELHDPLAELYLEKGMYRLAAGAASGALRQTPDDELSLQLALALYGQGSYREAAKRFEQVLGADPENLVARRHLVDLYRRLGKPDASLGEKERLTALEESAVRARLDTARIRKDQFDFQGAAAALQEAHEIRPEDPQILRELAEVLLAAQRMETAVSVLRELVATAPGEPASHLTLAIVCARSQICEPGEAEGHLEIFLTIAPPEDPNRELAQTELEALTNDPGGC